MGLNVLGLPIPPTASSWQSAHGMLRYQSRLDGSAFRSEALQADSAVTFRQFDARLERLLQSLQLLFVIGCASLVSAGLLSMSMTKGEIDRLTSELLKVAERTCVC